MVSNCRFTFIEYNKICFTISGDLELKLWIFQDLNPFLKIIFLKSEIKNSGPLLGSPGAVHPLWRRVTDRWATGSHPSATVGARRAPVSQSSPPVIPKENTSTHKCSTA